MLNSQVCYMEEQINLWGVLTIINPKFTDDFPQLRNEIGMITLLSIESDLALIEFQKHAKRAFSLNSLLVLRDHMQIRADAERDAKVLSEDNLDDLRQIAICAETKILPLHRLAIQLALKDPIVLSYTMNTLQEELDIRRDQGYGR